MLCRLILLLASNPHAPMVVEKSPNRTCSCFGCSGLLEECASARWRLPARFVLFLLYLFPSTYVQAHIFCTQLHRFVLIMNKYKACFDYVTLPIRVNACPPERILRSWLRLPRRLTSTGGPACHPRSDHSLAKHNPPTTLARWTIQSPWYHLSLVEPQFVADSPLLGNLGCQCSSRASPSNRLSVAD